MHSLCKTIVTVLCFSGLLFSNAAWAELAVQAEVQPQDHLFASSGSAPHIQFKSDFRFDVEMFPNSLPSYPEEVVPSVYKKLINLNWAIEIATQDITVEIESIQVVAIGQSGSKRLVYMNAGLNEHYGPGYEVSGSIPLRCFSNPNGSVRIETEIKIREITDDGRIDREPNPRKYISTIMPPFIPISERHNGAIYQICDRH